VGLDGGEAAFAEEAFEDVPHLELEVVLRVARPGQQAGDEVAEVRVELVGREADDGDLPEPEGGTDDLARRDPEELEQGGEERGKGVGREASMMLKEQPGERGDRGADHVRRAASETGGDHDEELLQIGCRCATVSARGESKRETRRTIVGHVLVHVLDERPLDDAALVHLLSHEHDELETSLAGLSVGLLGRQDGLGQERGQEVKLVGGHKLDEAGEELGAVALGGARDARGVVRSELLDERRQVGGDDARRRVAELDEDAVGLLLHRKVGIVEDVALAN
jgi:hypothetical protein